MSRPLRSVLVVVLSGVLSAALLYVATGWMLPLTMSGPIGDGSANGRVRGWFTTRGFHRPEIVATSSRQFSWTSGHAELRVPNLNRSRPYRVTLGVRAGRSGSEPLPHVIVSVDGARRVQTETSNERRDYVVEVPADTRSTLVIAIDVSNTFVPGPNDRRALGVIVEDLTIEPVLGRWRPTALVAILVALATMTSAAVALACGFTPRWTLVAGTLVAVANVWLLTRDGTFLGPYIERLINIAAGTGAAGIAATALRWRWPQPPSAPEWSVAVGFTIIAASLKIAFFGHPNVALADSIFQVHRAQNVVAGHYFFTSITPRPYFEFPYAIALYVTALPFWDWFPAELDRVRLLRGLTIVADAIVAMAMYLALRRAWPNRLVALTFVILWPFARAPVNSVCTSNLTNVYGQGLFGVAMGLVTWMAASGSRSLAAVVAAVVLFTGAFLSHFSTVSVGVPLVATVGLLLTLGRARDDKRLGALVLAIVVTAAAASYVLYYSHFHAVYRATVDRVISGEGAGDTQSMAAPFSVKAERWLWVTRLEFGLPALFLAALGGAWIIRGPLSPALLVLAGWALTWLGFSVLGIATPIEMRASLAAAPVVLAMASFAIGSMATRSQALAAVAAIGATAVAVDGFTRWIHCLTG